MAKTAAYEKAAAKKGQLCEIMASEIENKPDNERMAASAK